ncbi:MAG: hypothetical protein PVI40_07335 [Chlamydiota bacterium]|jgi:hypothetical protein
MHPKLKIINEYQDFEKKWEEKSKKSAQSHPLKTLKSLPKMEGIDPSTKKNLRLKAFKYLMKHDQYRLFSKYFLDKPFKYGYKLIRSYIKKQPYLRQDDFFLYGVKSMQEFISLLKDPERTFILGFSYCHKPFECPSGRFTDKCIHDPHHPVCSQCFIGKCCNFTSKANTKLLFIPTVHYIGEKMLEEVHNDPKKKITFLITACELSLEMFKDFGNMLRLQGVGVRLDGRICNTMKAFELSEKGIKPGLTVVLDKTQQKMLELLLERKTQN